MNTKTSLNLRLGESIKSPAGGVSELKPEKLVGISQVRWWRMAFTKAPKGTEVLRGQKKVWGEERRETGEAARRPESLSVTAQSSDFTRKETRRRGESDKRESAFSCFSFNFTPRKYT